MNSRIRGSGLSALEMWTQRDQMTGTQLPISDNHLIQRQHLERQKNHLPSAKSKSHGKVSLTYDLKVGDLIYIRVRKTKLRVELNTL
jgi:hypothetical protein